MGNIQVKQNGPQSASQQQPSGAIAPPVAAPMTPWADPSRWVSRLMGWDPFREMTPFFGEERFQLDPAFDVKETKDSYVFKADVPGVKLADIDVSVKGNRLAITGKREAEKEDKHDTYYTFERSYGSFSRSFTLPEGVEMSKVQADLNDGVLSITLPKKPEAVAKKIPIGTGEKKT